MPDATLPAHTSFVYKKINSSTITPSPGIDTYTGPLARGQ